MKKDKGEHPFGDAGQLILLVVFILVWAADSFFLRWSTFPARFIPLYVRLVVLAASFAVGGWLANSGHAATGHDSSPAGVLKTGAFRHVRHPLYAGSMAAYFGLAISTASLLSLAVFVVIFIFYDFIAGYEEGLMEGKYGAEYTEYKRRTGRWLPRIGSR